MKHINYLYFGIYFLLLTLMSASSIFTKDPLSGSKFFFFLYAVGQIGLETILLASIGYFLQKKTLQIFFYFFIGATFVLFIFHGFDMIIDRILDRSVWSAFSLFVIHETFDNFIYLLDASGVPLWMWAIFFASLSLLPLIGVFLYKVTHRLSMRNPLSIPVETLFITYLSLPAALFFWDFSASRIIHPNTYTALLQSLPWKFTFLSPESISVNAPNTLSLLPNEEIIAKEIAAAQESFPPLPKKPNIYLFVIESFRSDIISQEITPHLLAFQNISVPIQSTFSNANASHQSWFSIFHSQFSYYWHLTQKQKWSMGSPPLALLKNLGYQINLYSSAQLGYYGMNELLFGKKETLLNTAKMFPHQGLLSAADTDKEALETLLKDIHGNPSLQEGQIFLVFWDATHFDYQWPKTWTPKFTPFSNDFAYFQALYSQQQVGLIKNRYKNAAHYIDHLFGDFLANIPDQENAIILVTGDHGEEFCEHGHLFHGSHLMQEQIKVPILMKFGKKELTKTRFFASQMDIFPSLFDHLYGKVPSFLQGQSVLREMSWPFLVISRFNAGISPSEFCLYNGKNKLIARFGDIETTDKIEIVSLLDGHDRNLPASNQSTQSWIEEEFGAAWERLFPNY